MQLAEAQSAQTAQSWSAEEELIIKTIQHAESVPRAEAIRRMQRRKKTSRIATDRTSSKRVAVPAAGRMCRNPRCTRGEDHIPGSLAHLRADALYCDATCKKAGQRSLKRENRASNRQCLSWSKGDKSGSLLSPPLTNLIVVLKSPAIEIVNFLDERKLLARPWQNSDATDRKRVDRELVLNKTKRVGACNKT
jgi:hypothetical protein